MSPRDRSIVRSLVIAALTLGPAVPTLAQSAATQRPVWGYAQLRAGF